MLRTQKEWYEWCLKRGTTGSIVFDILKDWEEDVADLERIVSKLNNRLQTRG